ncbi:MAG: hypothetical protein LH628_12755 [Microcoleus sp. CAN_BIN18]|nr:hypothetical protein [Microcoleus sp. CAN_BIN18]
MRFIESGRTMGLELAGTPASGGLECSIDSRADSAQHYLTIFDHLWRH